MHRTWMSAVLSAILLAVPALANDGRDKEGSGKESPAPSGAPAGKNTTGASKEAEKTPSPNYSAEIEQLREMILQQARQIDAQQQKLDALTEELRAARTGSAQVGARVADPSNLGLGAPVATTAAAAAPSVAAPLAVSTAVSAAPGQPVNRAQGYGKEQGEKKSPLSFKIGDADFTPGGFLDMTSVNRTTNVGSGIGTSFGSIPFNNGGPAARLTESRLTAQNSRLSLRVNSKFGAQDILGYVETDFLGFQPPNANQTSNSNSLRLRLYFVDIKRDKWEFQGGQMWTWMTPNRVGLSPMPSDIFYTQNMDTNYQVGLTWARQTGFRIAYHPTSFWAIGVSVENPQQFVPTSVVLPGGGGCTSAAPSPFCPQFETGSGATNTATSGTNPAVPNLHPDIIVKTAFDGHVSGRAMHVEAAGLFRSFKVFNTLATPTRTNSITGGGGSVNVNLELVKNFHLIGNSFYSYGGGRYIFGLGPDVIVRPDGTLSGVHSGSGIGGFEWQANRSYMLYGYYGGAYFKRNFGVVPATGTFVGFGFPGSSSSANRTVQEGTFGIVPTLWSNPNYGKLQVISQYSYLTRVPWSVAAGAPKNAHTNLIYADLRYTLP